MNAGLRVMWLRMCPPTCLWEAACAGLDSALEATWACSWHCVWAGSILAVRELFTLHIWHLLSCEAALCAGTSDDAQPVQPCYHSLLLLGWPGVLTGLSPSLQVACRHWAST